MNSENPETSPASPQDDRALLRADALFRLEWHRIAQALADEAVLPGTQAKLLQFEPWIDPLEREWIFSATEEVRNALSAGTGVALSPFDFEQVRAPLGRQAVLPARGLYEIYTLTLLAKAASEFVKLELRQQAGTSRYPHTLELFSQIIPQPRLCEQLKISVDADGNLLSTASPELRSSRGRLENAKRKIVESLESLLRKNSVRDALQDTVWTIRDGRYVLPVRADRKGDITGIPRGVSQTGSTLFIEPIELASAQNQVEQAEVDVQLEEARVLRALSELAASVREPLFAAAEILSRYDDLCARAKLSHKLDGQRPHFHSQREELPAFSFEHARHPLFILENKKCRENDLSLTNYYSGSPNAASVMPRVWVISGPNAGGKTVAMRTVGLLTLMAHGGLFIPAENPSLYEFQDVFVELGDRQSREDDLSTFSGHLLHLKKVIDLCSERTLVLLDEGFVGTDPALGSSMARATLEYFAQQNTTVIITTHFSSLKTLADADPRFLNASMEFEPKQLRPTYLLLNGVPGQSYALELATRLGFEPSILKTALAYHGEEAQKLESLLADLQRKRADMADELESSRKLNLKLEQELGALRDERKSIEELRGTLVDGYRTKLQKRLNAFENRLEIRERQYERHKEELLRESREAATEASRAVAHSAGHAAGIAVGNTPANSSADSAPTKNESRLEFSRRHAADAANANAASAHADRNKPRSGIAAAHDFSALAHFAFPTRPGQPSPAASAKNALDEQAKRFRPPAKMTPRDLLDEARESLATLGESFDSIAEDFDSEVSELAELENKTSARVAKTKTDVQKARNPVPAAHQRPAGFWQPKMRVKAAQWREVGEVLRSADSKGMVECQFGLIKAKVSHEQLLTLQDAAQKTPFTTKAATPPPAKFVATPKLTAPPPPQPKPTGPVKFAGKGSGKVSREKNLVDTTIEPAFPHGGNSVDLRGKLVDSALEKLEQYLDRAWREDINPIVIVHGHGTGRVKSAVREFLAGASYNLKFRPGSSGEGGDGATVVVFL